MPSSTSRSEQLHVAAIFAVGFALLTMLGLHLVWGSGLLRYAQPEPTREEAPPGNGYVDHALGVSSRSHLLLYYDFGGAAAGARSADLLLLGNSRALLAFTPEKLDAFAARHGILYFNLAFGHAEPDLFPARIIQRLDLHPRWVVVNEDAFFHGHLSEYARRVIGGGGWDSVKATVEAHGRYAYEFGLQRAFPHFLPELDAPGTRSGSGRQVAALLRSWDTGSSYPWKWGMDEAPVDLEGGRPTLAKIPLLRAQAFRDIMGARGAQLILTQAPSSKPFVSRAVVRLMGERLGVPVILPDLDGLTTRDGSHLTPDSAARFSQAFLREFEERFLQREPSAPHAPDQE